jgi:hypothetical protein
MSGPSKRPVHVSRLSQIWLAKCQVLLAVHHDGWLSALLDRTKNAGCALVTLDDIFLCLPHASAAACDSGGGVVRARGRRPADDGEGVRRWPEDRNLLPFLFFLPFTSSLFLSET